MKNLNKIYFLLLIGLVYSCAHFIKNKQPEILTAQYEVKTYSEFERGYEVFLVIGQFPENCKIKSIILKNKEFDDVQFTEMQKNEVFVEQFLPLQSKRIQNFEAPKTDNRADGIIFELNGEEFYKEINFKLK